MHCMQAAPNHCTPLANRGVYLHLPPGRNAVLRGGPRRWPRLHPHCGMTHTARCCPCEEKNSAKSLAGHVQGRACLAYTAPAS